MSRTPHRDGSFARVRLSAKEKMRLLVPYARKRVVDQIKSVSLIVVYLILFQIIVLDVPIADALVIAVGIAVIVLGLALFMEGLFLGLMPLGETIGIKLPQKSPLAVILIFAVILGVGATFAEPAIGVLQIAGSFIKAWDAPLLFVALNKHAQLLKYAVGIGVGLAVAAGMLRFMFNWSLKPFLYIGVPIALAFSIWANFDPNMKTLSGVAWDCGGVTTGPVTVPLVLALGIGVCRVVRKNETTSGGFGVVTLASLFPVITVFLFGLIFLPAVPRPMDEVSFFRADNRSGARALFTSDDAMVGYALRNANPEAQLAAFDGSSETMLAFVSRLSTDEALRTKVFGTPRFSELERWAISRGSEAQRLAVFGSADGVKSAVQRSAGAAGASLDVADVLKRNGISSIQAIAPLVLLLVLVLLALLRERLPHPDELFIGVAFALVGMFLFNIGIELGLSKLGGQTGSTLPSAIKKIELPAHAIPIRNFDERVVQSALTPDGRLERFFYVDLNGEYVQVPFEERNVDQRAHQYAYVPTRGPMFGSAGSPGGIIVILLFAFIMGYGATLAEPALNALGATVEVLTVGAFRKSLLMQAVAVGVGVGIMVGVMKIIWDVPLVWLLAPPYLLLLPLSKLSTEEFVNIGWDSAGVTTGPITVPLVLAMGLGISTQVGAVEGFGILATASVFPILSVLTVGLAVSHRRKTLLSAAST